VFNSLFGKLVFALCLVWLGFCAHAQVSLPNTLQAAKTSQPIVLDGELDDPIWVNAPRITNFTQRELHFGEPVSERTEVAIAFDDNNLYIAVWCFDSNANEIIAKELKRDFNYEIDDNFIVVIDTYNDKRNGFMFVTNPNAARADLQVFNNGGSTNAFWNGVWNVKTKRNKTGWFAEFEIPFYTFKYRNNVKEQIWGINFERNIRHKREQACWQGWSRNNRISQVNQAGTLTGLNHLTNNSFIEIKPYVLGGYQTTPNERKPTINAGGDINALLSPTYRLNLTFNTDFAQVESDQQQINITRFPLFFPELREFFLEGDDFFNMGFGGNRIIPFYTRRIGLSNGEAIPIIAGARLLGKEQNSTVGLMSIQTEQLGDNPLTNYTIGSWRQDIGRQSVAGVMSVNKFTEGRWHTTTGVNGRFSTAKFLKNKNLDIGGAFIQTYNSDSGYEQKAYAYRFFVAYINDLFTVFTSTQRSPVNFRPEAGLLIRSNFSEYFGEVAFKPRPNRTGPLGWIRQFEFVPLSFTQTLYDETGKMQSFEYSLQFLGFETRKGERFTASYSKIGEGLNRTFELSDAIKIDAGEYYWNQWDVELRTFRGRTLSVINLLTFGEFYKGNAIKNRMELLWRTGKYLNVNIRYEYNDIVLPEGTLTTHLVGSRMEYAINPNAFGALLAQWNTAQEELNINYRLHIIPKIGTDFYLIMNQLLGTENNEFQMKRFTILGKLVWRFTM